MNYATKTPTIIIYVRNGTSDLTLLTYDFVKTKPSLVAPLKGFEKQNLKQTVVKFQS